MLWILKELKWNYIKGTLPHSKRNHQQNENQFVELEEVFASHIFNKVLIFKMYSEPYDIAKKQRIQLKQGQKTCIENSQKIHKWTTCIRKGAQHY